MDNAISQVAANDQLDMATPDEVSGLTSAVLEATAHTTKMTDEMVQLSNALDKLKDKNDTFKRVRAQAKSKMQSIIVDL